jgi:hypothetical protein
MRFGTTAEMTRTKVLFYQFQLGAEMTRTKVLFYQFQLGADVPTTKEEVGNRNQSQDTRRKANAGPTLSAGVALGTGSFLCGPTDFGLHQYSALPHFVGWRPPAFRTSSAQGSSPASQDWRFSSGPPSLLHGTASSYIDLQPLRDQRNFRCDKFVFHCWENGPGCLLTISSRVGPKFVRPRNLGRGHPPTKLSVHIPQLLCFGAVYSCIPAASRPSSTQVVFVCVRVGCRGCCRCPGRHTPSSCSLRIKDIKWRKDDVETNNVSQEAMQEVSCDP